MANSKWPVDENGFPANSQTFPMKYSQGARETTNNLLFVKTSNGNETKAAKGDFLYGGDVKKGNRGEVKESTLLSSGWLHFKSANNEVVI